MRPTEFRAMPSPHSSKKETDPIAVIKWKEIYENFEAGTDRCEDVANILERIAFKAHVSAFHALFGTYLINMQGRKRQSWLN